MTSSPAPGPGGRTPPTVRLTALHGHDLSYVDSGTGPAILFIHGLLGSHENWTHLVDKLDDRHRVVIPDLFGHGASAKPVGDYSLGAHAAVLRDLIDLLGIDRVTLVGHSLGGGIAMQFCYLFPQRVERLVLVATGGLGRTVSPLLRSATLPGAELVLPVIASSWVRERVEGIGHVASWFGWRAGADASAAWQGFTSLSDAESRRAFLATTRAVIDPGGQTVSARGHLPSGAPIPTLVVWGTRDRMIPVGHANRAHEVFPDARVVLFEGAGHFPHLEQPERFSAVLDEFIATGTTPPGARPEGQPSEDEPDNRRRTG
ncbi:hydrolase [Intrasporangium oryzae NRRL B-24470]|uniref:Hydrolase n=1 Tax=Intrasporangium oryzae NRRL B-24470 TaxID=1386089 RepID=W9G8Y0_9MICO|nr:alpha/beta fold hydrolase [Intrasporangium oryzae]EWT02641.1 hydrolase [Intrasporangium oryzae NRRL B-24470]